VIINSIAAEIRPAFHPASAPKRADQSAAAPAKDAAALAGPAARAAEPSTAEASPSIFGRRQPLVAPVINGQGIGLKFSVDEETGTRIIQVINVDTGDVVRQIPPQEVIEFMHRLDESKGSLISIKL